jgi:hypothetical protein
MFKPNQNSLSAKHSNTQVTHDRESVINVEGIPFTSAGTPRRPDITLNDVLNYVVNAERRERRVVALNLLYVKGGEL